MSFLNPNDNTEVIYGASGDVRNELNGYLPSTTVGHFAGEAEFPGQLIIDKLVAATRLINAFLEVGYPDTFPLSTVASVPKFLETCGDDIALYYVLRSSRVMLGKLTDEKKMEYFDRYVSADKSNPGFLVRIANREIQLNELSNDSPDFAKSVMGTGKSPVFDMGSEFGWGPDQKTIDDSINDRQ